MGSRTHGRGTFVSAKVPKTIPPERAHGTFWLRILLRPKVQGAHPMHPLEAVLLTPVPVALARHPDFAPAGQPCSLQCSARAAGVV